jgi:hypothetical protein
MADEDRTFQTSTTAANRAQHQGLGVGQREMDKQLSPNPDEYATDPQRTEPFDQTLDPTTNADRPSQADFAGQEPGDLAEEARSFSGTSSEGPGAALDDRDAAGLDEAGDLGASTPAGVDIHDLGQRDAPQEDWGEAAGEEATFSSNHSRKGVRTEAERGQGAKTRQHNKDQISRRT